MTEQILLNLPDNGAESIERFDPLTCRDLAISEANHQISSNLALLASTVSMRAADYGRRDAVIGSHEAAAALHEITARIATVGHLHRLLAIQPGGQAQFGPHLRELCRLFIAVLAGRAPVELVETGIADCPVQAEHFLPLSLIVTEVVTNALKYAHPAGAPGKLMVGCRCESGGAVVIEVADDGVGFPEGFDFADHRGTGSRTIHVLAQQIDAQIAFDSRPTGLRFVLRLPAADAR